MMEPNLQNPYIKSEDGITGKSYLPFLEVHVIADVKTSEASRIAV